MFLAFHGNRHFARILSFCSSCAPEALAEIMELLGRLHIYLLLARIETCSGFTRGVCLLVFQ
jgi:hypothetical protein